jgi:simple sugar transport system ATP-binding protein
VTLDSQIPLVEAVGITKCFGALVANDDINLAIHGGEVHAVLGENGAGKTTLTRIIYGLSQPDSGELLVNGLATRIASPREAMAAGIGVVTQEFSLVGPMTVTENVMLAGVGLGAVDRRVARAAVVETAERIGVQVDPDARVEQLSVGERQRVEILKALHHECRVLILDEPTAVLTPLDVDALFETVRRLRAAGIGVVFISHKLREVVSIADRVTVLRRGRVVTTQPLGTLDTSGLADLMIGHTAATDSTIAPAVGALLDAPEPLPVAEPPTDAAAVLEVRNLDLVVDGVRRLDDISLSLASGEIVGIAGVSGNGQTELVHVLCATAAPTSGSIHVDGVDVTAVDVVGRIRAGLGRITEDRRGSVVPGLTVEQNLVLEDLDRFRQYGFTQRGRVRQHARRLIADFDIRAEPHDIVGGLSGGNLQKVLLARALSRDPRALVAAQPTRGLDVGAYAYVHDQLRRLRDSGGGVLVISEDLDELLALADRLVVLYAGRIIGELPRADATPRALGLLMTGHEGAFTGASDRSASGGSDHQRPAWPGNAD